MSARTRFLSRLIGLYSILVSLSMMTHKQATVETLRVLMHNAPLLLIAGVMAVAIGLAIILGHNVWSGGPVPVLVTLVGWGTLVKGLLLLFLSPEEESRFFLGGLRYEQLFYVYTGILLLLGIFMTYGATDRRHVK